jgi:lipoate-protein ligase A
MNFNLLPPSFDQTAGEQLARSDTFLASLMAETATPALWWYAVRTPALILGAAQKTDILDEAECNRQQIATYKRTSGGALVLAEPDFLSLDIALPPQHPLIMLDVTESYRWLGELWLETLVDLGVKGARLVTVAEVRAERAAREVWNEAQQHTHKLASLVCFGTLSPYEVVSAEGRKLVGLAQVRRRSGVLFQVGLPFLPQHEKFPAFLALPEPDKTLLATLLRQRITSLEQELPGYVPQSTEVIAVFQKRLVEKYAVTLQPQPENEQTPKANP